MKIVSQFPNSIEEIHHVEIPMSDGCRLGARIWMPQSAPSQPVPAIFEFQPYRKNDIMAERDVTLCPYLAGHGYAVVRVDLRGSGDSEGVLTDEYTPQELQDGCEVIAWIAEQDWCDGKVGITGKSWSGFNGLQIAALQPPALKAVLTLCSTDDRYADDIHYSGGCVLGEQLTWSSIMFGKNTMPPDPANVGERWREMWLDRLRGSGLWLKTWMQHQTRDAFWKHGSVCEDFSRIKIPVFAVSGWADGYYPAVFRMMEHLQGPRKGLIGPWAHLMPNAGLPGPQMGFLQEVLRWWDHWLKGHDTGIMDEPMLRLYMQHSAEPKEAMTHRDGHWVAESNWPSPTIGPSDWYPSAEGTLATDAPGSGTVSVNSPVMSGGYAGFWCAFASDGDLPGDQRRDDALSACFDSAPLSDSFDIVGQPVLRLAFSSDKPVAQIAVRLNEVLPSGSSSRVTYAVLNLTHRNSHKTPEALVPGQNYEIEVPLRAIAHRFGVGNRIRVALSTSYFPLIWPTPEAATLTLYLDRCCLTLPDRQPSPLDETLHAYPGPEQAAPLETMMLEEGEGGRTITHDVVRDIVTVDTRHETGRYRIVQNGLEIEVQGREVFSASAQNPAGAEGKTRWVYQMSRGDWSIRTETEVCMTATPKNWQITATLRAFEGTESVHEEHWSEEVPRNLN